MSYLYHSEEKFNVVPENAIFFDLTFIVDWLESSGIEIHNSPSLVNIHFSLLDLFTVVVNNGSYSQFVNVYKVGLGPLIGATRLLDIPRLHSMMMGLAEKYLIEMGDDTMTIKLQAVGKFQLMATRTVTVNNLLNMQGV